MIACRIVYANSTLRVEIVKDGLKKQITVLPTLVFREKSSYGLLLATCGFVSGIYCQHIYILLFKFLPNV